MYKFLTAIIAIIVFLLCFSISYYNRSKDEGADNKNSTASYRAEEKKSNPKLLKISKEFFVLLNTEKELLKKKEQLHGTFLEEINTLRGNYNLSKISANSSTPKQIAENTKTEIFDYLKEAREQELITMNRAPIRKILADHDDKLEALNKLINKTRQTLNEHLAEQLNLVKIELNENEAIWISKQQVSCNLYESFTGMEKPENYSPPPINPLTDEDKIAIDQARINALDMKEANNLKIDYDKRLATYESKVRVIRSRIAEAERVTGPNRTAAQGMAKKLRRELNGVPKPSRLKYDQAFESATAKADAAKVKIEKELYDLRNAKYKDFPIEVANSTNANDIKKFFEGLNSATENHWDFGIPSADLWKRISENPILTNQLTHQLNEHLDDGTMNNDHSLFKNFPGAGFRIVMKVKD